MAKNKLKKGLIQNSKHILPLETVGAVLGGFFTVVSILYIVIVSFCVDTNLKLILLILEGFLSFLCMFFIFFYIAVKNNRKFSREIYVKCNECIQAKIHDSLHLAGLLYLSELLEIEKELVEDPQPECCEVLIYTSDLATEDIARKVVEKNLEKKVKYKIIYFNNSYSPNNTTTVNELYGAENIIDLTQNPIYENTVDSNLAKALGFDIMIYKTSNDKKRGFFAVNFVVFDKGICPFRPKHQQTCQDKCENMQTFYKEMSSDLTDALYSDFNKIFGVQYEG